MTINKIKDGNALTLKIEGRLETTTAPDLEKVIKEELDGVENLTFDFSGVDYISSAGLRVLLSAQKTMKNAMKVTGANEIVTEIFDITGFSDILNIE